MNYLSLLIMAVDEDVVRNQTAGSPKDDEPAIKD